jgi:hypothetical protein
MTVASTTNRKNYTGNGVLDTYAYDFKVFAKTDLKVYVDEVLLTVDTDYTVTGVGVITGGNVVFTTPPPLNDSIVILRSLPLTQGTDYIEGDPFPADSHEDALDRLVMIAQQFDEAVDRILTLPITSLLTNIEVPVLANACFRWNATADELEAVLITTADALNLITTQGDIIIGASGGTAARLGIGATGKVLRSNGAGADPSWEDDSKNIVTTRGDILFRNATTLTRLGAGTSGQVLQTKGTGADPVWVSRFSRKIILPASCFESRVAAGWANFVQTQGTNFDYVEYDFDKDADEKIISPPFRLTNWDAGAITIRIAWKANANTGTVVWVASFVGIADGEPFDAAMSDHAFAADTISDVAEDINISSLSVTPAELANNDTVILKISRDISEDDLGVDAKLLYVEIEYNEV